MALAVWRAKSDSTPYVNGAESEDSGDSDIDETDYEEDSGLPCDEEGADKHTNYFYQPRRLHRRVFYRLMALYALPRRLRKRVVPPLSANKGAVSGGNKAIEAHAAEGGTCKAI